MPEARRPVSIVTVFNDPTVRRACLDRSIDAHRQEALDVDYVPVDNTGGAFASAGAALNHGAATARHDVVAFVHQDVYLHSLTALEAAAGRLLADPGIGLLGAVGVTAEGRFVGTVRDRVFLLGEPAPDPVPVDSLDELLFLVPRRVLAREPLSEAPELAWHAYAVEYGLRVRRHGLRTCAVDVPVTHNSLTVNLERLDVAYAAVAAMYPDEMPLVTPGGTVGAPRRLRDRTALLEGQRWRYTWLRESRDAHAGRRATGGSPCVLGDIRLDVDDLLARCPEAPLLVVSVDRGGRFADADAAPLALSRAGRPILVTSRAPAELPRIAAQARPGRPLLVTNLLLDDLRGLAVAASARERIVGFRRSLGYWMLLGVAGDHAPEAWRSRAATPLGMPALSA